MSPILTATSEVVEYPVDRLEFQLLAVAAVFIILLIIKNWRGQ